MFYMLYLKPQDLIQKQGAQKVFDKSVNIFHVLKNLMIETNSRDILDLEIYQWLFSGQ